MNIYILIISVILNGFINNVEVQCRATIISNPTSAIIGADSAAFLSVILPAYFFI
jgi:hypothetical protein